ncbi:MAG: M20/M25/M40 family metallo-hydrolase [Candidatus Berkelbacteria bacterium]|nr:M20/M25/M40 family metallo-hydrolase [Candidatus Berkelbacteria bacterium]
MKFEQFLNNLISFDTVSTNSNLALISFVEYNLKKMGFTTIQQKIGTKANLFAFKQSKERIIFAGHTDTVPASGDWTSKPFDLQCKSDKYYGLGVVDMKGFLSFALDFAANNLDNQKLAFLLTFDEETDFGGAKNLPNDWICPSDTVILGEPTECKIMVGNKGLLQYSINFTGRGGHGSEPQSGISAILESAKFLNYFESNFDMFLVESDNTFENPSATFNFGKISGGDAVNKIPEKLSLDLDIRILSQKQQGLIEKLYKNFQSKAKIDIELSTSVPPFQSESKLIDKIRQLNLPISPKASYTTEASYFGKFTEKVLIFGPGSVKQAHTTDEYLDKSDLLNYKNVFSKLLENIGTEARTN